MAEFIEIRRLTLDDYRQLIAVMKDAYANWQGSVWSLNAISTLIEKFPEGQMVICVDDRIVGCALSIIVDYNQFGDEHTYKDITGNYTFSTHDPEGDVLYGIDVFIHPEFRGKRLGRRLYDARKELAERLNLRSIVFGGRIPQYHMYAAEMKPREYISRVRFKEIHDPVLNFQLSNDFHPKKVLTNYMPGDAESRAYAVLLEWDNIYYVPQSTQKKRIQRSVRLGLVQWQMRSYKSMDEMYRQAEYFIDSISGYKADFALFPEFFNAPLMALVESPNEAEAMRQLSQYTEEIRDKFSEWAIRYNVNIITGSMPLFDDNGFKNVGYLCHRNGKVEMYEKIHVTPDEVKYWGLKGGSFVRPYDTDAGRIGVLICYDVEFPELARVLSLERVQLLFVPFLTDTYNSYMRVRHCAAARAIENECFVAITGSVGNLPQVENMDLHYSQAVVFTPCDFQFPANGIKSEATANTEMVLISDVDLSLLEDLHYHGSVRNLLDRRNDLYRLSFLNKENPK